MGISVTGRHVWSMCRSCGLAASIAIGAMVLIALALAMTWRSPSTIETHREIPAFDLPGADGSDGLSSKDFSGHVVILTVWSSWCADCRAEQKTLASLVSHYDVPLYGLDYRDRPAAARELLKESGHPFTRMGVDADGAVAARLGIFAIPESLLVGPDGQILHRHTGVVTSEAFEAYFLPLIEKARTR